MVNKLTDENIDNILQSDRTFVVIFYSEKLPNLPNIMPIFEEFDIQFKGKIDVYKCEIDNEFGKLASYFKMSTLPAMVMMKNNKAYANMAGPSTANNYQNAVKEGIMEIMREYK